MNPRLRFVAALTVTTLALAACGSGSKSIAKRRAEPVKAGAVNLTPTATAPPASMRQETVDVIHGERVADPYRWLEDASTPEVQAWVDAQDAYARAHLAAIPARDALAQRFTELFYIDSVSAPRHRGGRFFYTRRHKDKEKAVVYWREGKDGPEQVLIDPNTLSDDGSVSLGGTFPSWDGRYVAYKLKANNADEATLYVRDVAAGKDSEVDVITGAKYAHPSWAPDSSGFYYTYLPSGPHISVADRPGYAEVRYHHLGRDPAADKAPLVFPRTGSAKTFLWPQLSRDGRYLLIYIQHGWNASDVYFRDLKAPVSPSPVDVDVDVGGLSLGAKIAMTATSRGFIPLVTGREATFDVEVHDGRFYILTNDGAPRGRIYSADPSRPARAAWREIVSEGEHPIEGFQVVGGHLVLRMLKHAASDLEIRRLDGALVRDIELPSLGSVDAVVGRADEDTAYFSFSSFTQPSVTYEVSIATGKTSVWAEVELPVDTDQFEVEQVFYPSKDGTRVSMFIVRRKDATKNRDQPVLLYGYGGFNVNMTPDFRSSIVTWLDQGGVYAVPNLRGGGEYGEAWHKAGMGLVKQNVFDDFIAAAEFLIREGWTRPERLAIRGGSNGGLLVGAAMTQRPDLFRAVICAVPLLDMVRYHLFGSGKTWIPEYGSAEDPEQFKALYAYSPYHRARAGVTYPAMMMAASDSDDRVDPLHARKFTALIQWAQADATRPVIMRVERQAGHGGGDMVKKTVANYADQWAFLMEQLGMLGPQ